MNLEELERRLRAMPTFGNPAIGEAADLIAKLRALEPAGEVIDPTYTHMPVQLPYGTKLYSLEGIK